MNKIWNGLFVVIAGIILKLTKLADFICSMVKKKEKSAKDVGQKIIPPEPQNSPKTSINNENNALTEVLEEKGQPPGIQNQPQTTTVGQVELSALAPTLTPIIDKINDGGGEMPENKEKQIIQALRIAVVDKFNPLCIYTQMYHESGAFKKPIGIWNYAGLKMPRQLQPDAEVNGWGGKTIKATTHETINGISIALDDYFVDFSSADNLVKFYCFQVKRLFKEAYKNRDDYKLFFWWLTRDKFKYATDPNYSEKLITLYSHLKADGMEEIIDKSILI